MIFIAKKKRVFDLSRCSASVDTESTYPPKIGFIHAIQDNSLVSTHPPISRLPRELLLEIFKEYYADFARTSDEQIDSEPSNPQIAPVCRSWWKIIQTCPLFWSTINLNTTHDDFVDKAQYRLDRAGNVLLAISIYPTGDAPTQERRLGRLAQLLCPLMPGGPR